MIELREIKAEIKKNLRFLVKEEKYVQRGDSHAIQYTRLYLENEYRITFTCFVSLKKNVIQTFIIEKSIPEVERIMRDVFGDEILQTCTIILNLSKKLHNDLKHFNQNEYQTFIETKEQVAEICQLVKSYYCGQEVQDFLNLSLEGLNEQLIPFNEQFMNDFFLHNGTQFLRTYIVGRLCNNQAVIDYGENSWLPPIAKGAKTDEYYRKFEMWYYRLKDYFDK
jgi:hypothetical protein